MYELLAMSGKFPTHTNLSLLEYSRHGGATSPHAEEWRIASGMEPDFRIIKEPKAARDSDCVAYIRI